MINPMDLTGRHIVVTGASSGIGAETCRHIARLGGRVSLVARNEERLMSVKSELEGEGHACYVLDLSDPKVIEDAVSTMRIERGSFDGCVYCAGVEALSPLRQAKPEKLADAAAVNYLSFVEFVRCVALKKNRSETMSVVGVSSTASMRGEKGKTMYCSTKAAMNGAMRAMAHELADSGVRVNNVLPGWVRTGMFDGQMDGPAARTIEQEFELIQYMGEPLEPIDVANAIVFLLSDASRFITGTSMVVAGGALT